MKVLKWRIQDEKYVADICMIWHIKIRFTIIPYQDGSFGFFIDDYFHSSPKRLKTAQNKAQKIYDKFLEDQRLAAIE